MRACPVPQYAPTPRLVAEFACSLTLAGSNAAAGRIPATAAARYGLAVRRAPMRTLPSDRAFYEAPDQRDYESLTAGTLFPGEPVLIVHASAGGHWLLAVTTHGPPAAA